MFVQFSDSSESEVIAVFSCQQSESSYPNQGELDASDPRYVKYYNVLPVGSRAGLVIPTASTP